MERLLVPIPVPAESGISVIFGRGWSARTPGKTPRRWLVGRRAGSILFLNRHEYPVTARLSFNLTTLVKGSSVRIGQGQNGATVRLRRKAARVTLTATLLPGENPLELQYVGTADEAEEIANVAVSRLAVDGAQDDLASDMNRLGEGYYAAAMSDGRVRNALHNHGYSEIECIRLYRDNSIQRERTTRFLQHDPNSSGDSFFVLKEGEKQENASASVRLYIAKKTGEIE